MMLRLGRVLAGGCLLALAGCIAVQVPAPPPEPDRLTLVPATFDRVPGWEQDRHAEAIPPLIASCGALADPRIDTHMGDSSPAIRLMGTAADWRSLCQEAARVAPGDHDAARGFFERYFIVYQAGNNGTIGGLFTGYFEPELAGSRTRTGSSRTPLRGLPSDLIQLDLGAFAADLSGRRTAGRIVGGRLVPYPTRAEIEAGAVDGRAPVVAWVDDPVDAFFLHIQGSGRIRLPDGRVLRVGYAGQNGHVYVPIGRLLVERQALNLEQVSMQSIREWLRANPDQAQAMMNQNPSYVFFRELQPTQDGESAPGALGVPLTPMRSIAVDPRFVPLGVPLWVDVRDPDGEQLRRVMIAHDVGGAIRGPVRGDIFFGSGAQAGDKAGRMRSQGGYLLLLPRQAVLTGTGEEGRTAGAPPAGAGG